MFISKPHYLVRSIPHFPIPPCHTHEKRPRITKIGSTRESGYSDHMVQEDCFYRCKFVLPHLFPTGIFTIYHWRWDCSNSTTSKNYRTLPICLYQD